MIAQQTTIQAYQLHKGGTYARMAILRMIAADSVNNFNTHTRLTPGDWRKARQHTMKGYEAAYGTLDQGFNGTRAIWYAHTGEQFRNERDVSEVIKTRHTGWYCDNDQDSMCIGIVGSLTHGRFIAGYRLTESDERVYFDEIYTDEDSAAHAADSCAERYADKERDYQTVWREARDIEEANETAFSRLRECWLLRHMASTQYVRAEIADLCQKIRHNRKRLATEFKDYV